jgi:DNA repair protein SbcD/Mre11
MKILHTSDWHIGKQLQKIDLTSEMELFFDWLVGIIQKEKIELLLVSGDVFDQSNPSQNSLTQYYDFLKRMVPFKCKVVITGGNHDSASMLNAPKQILELVDVKVVGGAVENIKDLFFSFPDGKNELVVAAVPYLRDRDIRKAAPGESYADKIEQIREGLKAYFGEVNAYFQDNYTDAKFILMGHLYVQGAKNSDSERQIQIGNQAGVEQGIFGSVPNYVALGHIHKPYAVSKSNNIYYSGSPIGLSFSEKEDVKQVNIVDTSVKNVAVSILPVPKFRKVICFQGTFNEVANAVKAFKNDCPLDAIAELVIKEPKETVGIIQNVEDLMLNHGIEGLVIAKRRTFFDEQLLGGSNVFSSNEDVADFTPKQMFERRLELESTFDDDKKEQLRNAFNEIMETIKGVEA